VAAATANGMPASHPVSLSGRLDSERIDAMLENQSEA
jgi:hypothetical protein